MIEPEVEQTEPEGDVEVEVTPQTQEEAEAAMASSAEIMAAAIAGRMTARIAHELQQDIRNVYGEVTRIAKELKILRRRLECKGKCG
jgi:C4-dicarboxylate-specific signal transduction histidine kinase